jgi:beta-xylosidase
LIRVSIMKVAILTIGLLLIRFADGQSSPFMEWGYWTNWGDQGNGTYRNPVIPADFSDIDCIRVGENYYAISSTFQYCPGVIILQSKDLVNWRIIGHAVNNISSISPEMNWDRMNRYGKGIWAGAMRYHAGKFWIYFGTPDEGYFLTTATNAEGPWDTLHQVLSGKGWDDCCPFWDDDGKAYLVGTNFSDNYAIHLFAMTSDGTGIIKSSDKIIHQSQGSEANKLYKINGTYYHLFSEVKSSGRALMMERSRNIWGPYKEIKQLSHTQPQFNEPNQGGLVKTEKGDWYFLTHHGTGDWSGRIVSLLPVTWADGWPIIGKVANDDIGDMVWQGVIPVKDKGIEVPQTSDDFNENLLLPQWEWNYQSRAAKWSLTERKGWLRLHAFKSIQNDNLLTAGNTLTQRTYRTRVNEVIEKMDISGMAPGEKAGLSHFGSPDYAAIIIVCQGNICRLQFKTKGKIVNGPQIPGNIIWLKSDWGLDGLSRFYYSFNGKSFTPFAGAYQMKWEAYRGDRLAIFNYNNNAEKGYVDIDYLHYKLEK